MFKRVSSYRSRRFANNRSGGDGPTGRPPFFERDVEPYGREWNKNNTDHTNLTVTSEKNLMYTNHV